MSKSREFRKTLVRVNYLYTKIEVLERMKLKIVKGELKNIKEVKVNKKV